jgi:hypothetical protein
MRAKSVIVSISFFLSLSLSTQSWLGASPAAADEEGWRRRVMMDHAPDATLLLLLPTPNRNECPLWRRTAISTRLMYLYVSIFTLI